MRKNKRKSRKFFFFFVALVCICLGIVFKQEYEIYQIRQEKDATAERIDKLKQTKASLEKERDSLSDPEYIEKLARDEYNMVKKNEVPMFIVNESEDAKK